MNLEKITLMAAVVLTFAYITIPSFPPDLDHGIALITFSNKTGIFINEDLIGIIVFFMPYILLRIWRAK
ncbi:hypothetical protein N9386_01945 [Gammaproteobacteria bacterium]|nr:hypothetical protein [Gammaproteobacteria bacterium]